VATVTLSAPAPAGGAKVLLSSSDTNAATVPSHVTVTAGSTQKTFSVTTKPVAAAATVTLTASYGGQTGTAALAVEPPALVGLTLSPATVTGPCQTSAGKVTISGKAPAGGLSVDLSTTNAGASVPASVVVPAGQTYATFTVTAADVAARQAGAVTAALGSASFSKALTVMPNGLKALTLSPSSVTGPAPSTGTVSLACAAPAGGVTVSLSSSAPSVARPAVSSVVIPAGQTSATFSVETADVVTAGSATIRAAAKGVTKSVKLTVN
jgi:trimeric autotransporter adhesin